MRYMLKDVKDQVGLNSLKNEMEASPMHSFQVDDLTDVTSCAQFSRLNSAFTF